MMRSLCLLSSSLACIASAHAGKPVVRIEGVVSVAAAASGPFAGTQAGDPFTLQFEVITPGTLIQPGVERFAIDTPTFALTLANVTVGLAAGTFVEFSNNVGGAGDRVSVYAPQVSPTGNALCLIDNWDATMLQSTDPFQSVGTSGPAAFDDYTIEVGGNGSAFVFIFIVPTSFSISVVEGTPVCFGDGSGSACPCSNLGANGAGCSNSLQLGAALTGLGVASVSNDSLQLHSSGAPNGPHLFFQGTNIAAGGLGVAFGDGLLCASGSITRLGVVSASSHTALFPASGGTPISMSGACAPGDQRMYQAWYRDAAVGFCTSATFNLSNALAVTWAN